MDTWKIVVAYTGWLFAAAAIGLLLGLLSGELALAVRFVDAASPEQRTVVEWVAVVGFVVLAAVPFLLRNRVRREEATGRDD